MSGTPEPVGGTIDPVGLAWLVTVRWASVAASVAAVSVGGRVLGTAPPLPVAAVIIGLAAISNVILAWIARGRRVPTIGPALLVAFDIVTLSWLLASAGGPLNPVSVYFFVYIVLAALVLGTRWAWGIAALAIAGYGALFLTPHPELVVAGAMHPEIERHVEGMWWAFASTALLVAVLVARLAASVTKRDQALADLGARAVRHERLAGLATLAAGAAHELSTPLSTIAVAARELERRLPTGPGAVTEDLALIQAEVKRCRALLDSLAARAGQPAGEMPLAGSLASILDAVVGALPSASRSRVDVDLADDVDVVWPRAAVTRAIVNLVRNGLQATGADGRVRLNAGVDATMVTVRVVDTGPGLTPDELSRIGEPFFTTKPEGEGLGLGVFVSRTTAEQLGGSLSIDSIPGQGTTAILRLPRRTTGAPVEPT